MCIGMLFWGFHRPHRDFDPLGLWGCTLGLSEALGQMATSPRKEERNTSCNQPVNEKRPTTLWLTKPMSTTQCCG